MAAVTLRALSTASTNSRLGLNNRLGWALSSGRFAIRGSEKRVFLALGEERGVSEQERGRRS
jgi:hypothetical protein